MRGIHGCKARTVSVAADLCGQMGDGIVIGRVERFAAEVLPKYYKHNNYQSFVRQVGASTQTSRTLVGKATSVVRSCIDRETSGRAVYGNPVVDNRESQSQALVERNVEIAVPQRQGQSCWTECPLFLFFSPRGPCSSTPPLSFARYIFEHCCSVRQLNIYGFHKTRHDEMSCEFKHPHFRRGQRHLLSLIRRKSQTSNSSKNRDENVSVSWLLRPTVGR